MPRDEDFAFWNKAREQRLMTQAQVEECVELLYALEQVGSSQRAWDLAARKGYLTREQAEKLRSAPAERPAAEDQPSPTAAEPSPPLEPYVPPSAPKEDEKAPRSDTPPAEPPAQEADAEKPKQSPASGEEEPPFQLEPFIPVGAKKEQDEAKDEGKKDDKGKKQGPGLIQLPGSQAPADEEDEEEAEALPDEEELEPRIAFQFADEGDEEAEPDEEEEAEPAREPELKGHLLAAVRGGRAAKVLPLEGKPVSIGSDKSNTFVVTGAEVSPRHARITVGGGKTTLWDMTGENLTRVNGKADASASLGPNDLIQLGEALALYLPDYGDDPAPLLTTPVAAGGEPFAMLSALDGPCAGTIFYIGQQPAVVGKFKLAGVRIDAPSVDEFHAHLKAEPEGLSVVDLDSRKGVLVNNKPVSRAVLKTGDRIVLGDVTLKVEILRAFDESEPSAPAAAAAPKTPTQKPDDEKPFQHEAPPMKKKPSAPSDEAEARPGKIPLEPKREGEDAEQEWTPELPSEQYGSGDLVLKCIEGQRVGTTWTLDKPSMTLGRDRNADIRVSDLSISRRHTAIVITDKGVEARDMGSRNGILVNGRRVRSALLKPGDTLRVGQCVFVVEEAEGETPSHSEC